MATTSRPTEGREKLGLGLKAMRVLGIASPRGPAMEPGAEGGQGAAILGGVGTQLRGEGSNPRFQDQNLAC